MFSDIQSQFKVIMAAFANPSNLSKFEAILEQVQPQVSVASWFSVDCKMGVLTILLQSPKCFACEVYARDFIPGANEELKMNIGQQFLRALLQSWVERCDRDLLPKSEVWKGVLDESAAGGVPEYAVAIKTAKDTDGEGAAELRKEAAVMAQPPKFIRARIHSPGPLWPSGV
mgnify:CR=1 FL=1